MNTPRIIRWEDLPPIRRPASSRGWVPSDAWEYVADELRERPGDWAVVLEVPRSSAAMLGYITMIRKGRLVAFRPAGEFDCSVRTAEDGTSRLYVRYVGPKGAQT